MTSWMSGYFACNAGWRQHRSCRVAAGPVHDVGMLLLAALEGLLATAGFRDDLHVGGSLSTEATPRRSSGWSSTTSTRVGSGADCGVA